MSNFSNVFAWLLIVLGALITFLVKPILARKTGDNEQTSEKQNKIIYITKIIGMWLVIIGAAMIFIAGGMYGRY